MLRLTGLHEAKSCSAQHDTLNPPHSNSCIAHRNSAELAATHPTISVPAVARLATADFITFSVGTFPTKAFGAKDIRPARRAQHQSAGNPRIAQELSPHLPGRPVQVNANLQIVILLDHCGTTLESRRFGHPDGVGQRIVRIRRIREVRRIDDFTNIPRIAVGISKSHRNIDDV